MLAAIFFMPFTAHAISAEKAILVDAQTGRVLYEKRADERSLIASTTKIMTALVVCEQCNVLDRIRIPKEAVGIEGSSLYLQEGEVLTIQELLYGLMLHSGNDAAVALAIYCGGTVQGFAELMNDKAHVLGLENTHFENPNGLDSPGHYSTARDLATLSAYAMQNPIFRQTVSTKSVNISGRHLRNHNKLLWRIPSVDGIKTGYTKAAGRILVSSAMREGRRLVAVTINAPSDWSDHEKLIADGFSTYQLKQIVSSGDFVGEATVIGGEYEQVALLAAEDFVVFCTDQENVSIVISAERMHYAPIAQGQSAGFAYICVDNAVIGKVKLTYGETIERIAEKKMSFWDRLFGRNVS